MLTSKPKSIILYADDDIDDLDIFVNAIETYTSDTVVFTFRDGREIFQFIYENKHVMKRICLIVLDINMPVMNGLETLEKIRDIPELKGFPVILFSTSTNDKSSAKENGAHLITKPLHLTQMQEVIQELNKWCGGTLILRSRGGLKFSK